jgi:hypothetical protein
VAVANLSQHVRTAVEQERGLVEQRLSELRNQSERLHLLVERVDSEVDDTARLLRQMDEMLGLAPQLSLEALHGELRGQRLREIAVELLRQKKGAGVITVHYREWYELVLESGLRVAGRDPIATFLTQISRAPGVKSVRPRSGLYRLSAA